MPPKSPPRIIPRPAKLVPGEGTFLLQPETEIWHDDANATNARILRDLLEAGTGARLTCHERGPANVARAEIPERGRIQLDLLQATDVPEAKEVPKAGGVPEEYTLEVTHAGIHIQGRAPVGVFYGLQTLRQLLPVEWEGQASEKTQESQETKRPACLPVVTIRDAPRFPWRGYMLDEARYFHGKAVVKRLLEVMALLKLNRFHWHLTNDQGWRVEVPGYPKLTTVGAHRRGTVTGGFLSRKVDGKPHGGYYTRADLEEIVAYAAARHITIVPEVDMPGHVSAAIAAYPDLGCTGDPVEVSPRWGIHKDVLCVGNEAVFTFAEAVLDAVMAVFPGAVIHVGGDEVPKSRWKHCPRCQARMAAENLADARALQAYFTNRVVAYLHAHGRRAMGWNEFLNPALDPAAICHYWVRHKAQFLAHVRAGREAVMSNFKYAYLDHAYAFTPLSTAYAYEPIPAELDESHHERILGLEGLAWGEFLPSERRVHWQTFPRLVALAEVGWTPRARRDFADFETRWQAFQPRLDALGVHYARGKAAEPGWLRRAFSLLTLLRRQTGGT